MMLDKFRERFSLNQLFASTCWIAAWTLLNIQLIKSLLLF